MAADGRRLLLTLVAAGLVLAAAPACVPSPPASALLADIATDPDELARESVLRIRNASPCGVATGTGFVIDGRRLITNRHVVEGARRIDVETWDGRQIAVGTARQATDTDLAVIELPPRSARRLDPLPLAEDGAEPGDAITAIGYADGGPARTTRGLLADRPGRREELGESGPVLRMSIGLRHGNSGGPVIDRDQRVVGVAFAYDPRSELTLAIPMERLRAVLDDPSRLEPVTPC